VWHRAAQKWVKAGKLVMLGVIQEQHPDRCRLYAQWQQFGWPILHDPINVLETAGVPMFIAIDEHGVVRSTHARVETFEADFLNKTFAAPKNQSRPVKPQKPKLTALRRRAEQAQTAKAWRELGDAVVLWGGRGRINEAIAAYQQANQRQPKDGNTLFRLGVAVKMRDESKLARPGDFQTAVNYWQQALDTNPNQYIWRRRIQQYGPRLSKPYPFYDWVARAQREVRARGEQPVRLAVQPTGAEIAHPSRAFAADAQKVVSPDPKGRIRRDAKGLIRVEATVVPGQARAGATARVHLELVPNAKLKAYWNNEVEPLRIWVEAPKGWQVSRRLLVGRQGSKPETRETRRLDFEVSIPAGAAGKTMLKAYALYYVCEDVGGQCLYLRQDIAIPLTVAGSLTTFN